MLAIIKTGGKQYIVAPGDKIKVEKLKAEQGKQIEFPEVLLLEKNPSAGSGQTQLEIGTPMVKGAKVIGKILKQSKAKKVIIFKYKPKTRYKKKKGHRQPFTEVEITSISFR